MSGIAPS